MVLFLSHLDKLFFKLKLILLPSLAKIFDQGIVGVVNNFFALNVKLLLILPLFPFDILQISFEHGLADQQVNSVTKFRNLN